MSRCGPTTDIFCYSLTTKQIPPTKVLQPPLMRTTTDDNTTNEYPNLTTHISDPFPPMLLLLSSVWGLNIPNKQKKTFENDMDSIFAAMGIGGEPLPILWTADFIPVDNHSSQYVVGEFNCSSVSLDVFRVSKSRKGLDVCLG